MTEYHERLQRRARERTAARELPLPADPDDVKRLVEELRIHQVELEIQNEDLRTLRNELESSQRRYADLFHLAPVGYLVLDRSGLIREANLRVDELLGRRRAYLLGHPLTVFIHPDDHDNFFSLLREVYRRGRRQEAELRLRLHDERACIVQMTAEIVQRENGAAGDAECRAALIDVTLRKQAQQHLQQLYEEQRAILEHAADGIVGMDDDGRITFVNTSAGKLLGYDCTLLKGKFFFSLVHDDELAADNADRNWQAAADCPVFAARRPVSVYHHHFRCCSGEVLPVSFVCCPIDDPAGSGGAVLVFQDISLKMRYEEQMARTQKLESVGILAGGIAHDFNNILTVILGNASLAAAIVDGDDELSGVLDQVQAGCSRARQLTNQLLTFARGGAPVTEVASLDCLVDEIADFILHGTGIKRRSSYPDGLWAVCIDAGQVSQAIQNLVINAKEAMSGSGFLDIRAENVTLADGNHLSLEPGDYVRLAIADTGPGIAADLRDKIFVPYFSTKAAGSGLGLAITHSIITRHRGTVVPCSLPSGQGACFEVYLPATRERPVVRGEIAATAPAGPCAGRRMAVLVMDDENLVCNLAATILTRLGHRVDCVFEGREALSRYRQAMADGRPYDVVILDLTIPGGMGGDEVIRELVALNPDVRAVVSSGYSDTPIFAEPHKYGFCAILRKPYTATELKRVMENLSRP
ncbi:MAG: PAS domain S-box protein [Deltaproteobacteria bacterium]|nr:PAS domain S-box protein [Candidatus Anaeroferrophillacea bacterium]